MIKVGSCFFEKGEIVAMLPKDDKQDILLSHPLETKLTELLAKKQSNNNDNADL